MSKKTSGFTLIELLLALGVFATMLVAGITTYNMVYQGNRINETVKLIQLIQNTLPTIEPSRQYGPSGTSLLPILISSKNIPEKYIAPNGANLLTPFGTDAFYISSQGSGRFGIYMSVPNAYVAQVIGPFMAQNNNTSGGLNSFFACNVFGANGAGIQNVTPDQIAEACGDSSDIPDGGHTNVHMVFNN